MPGESHPPLLTRTLLTNNISQMEKGLCWGRMKKIEGLCHSECTKRKAEKREGKNGTLIVNRGLKTEIIVNRRFGCTCNVFFKIHSRDVCVCVCVSTGICIHTEMNMLIALRGHLCGVWNTFINQAALSNCRVNPPSV